jgi:hypothetical protein
MLVMIAVAWGVVFGVAAWLKPTDKLGRPRTMETHRQLGLPPCTFFKVTGFPCPSCGMTTSFSHLVHGDVGNSLRANPVGTLLAVYGLALVPWCLVSATLARRVIIHDYEKFATRTVVVFLALMVLVWGLRVGHGWLTGELPAKVPAKGSGGPIRLFAPPDADDEPPAGPDSRRRGHDREDSAPHARGPARGGPAVLDRL